MTNEEVQGSIALAGRGYTYRPGGNYKAGEFAKVTNLVLSPTGELRSRPGVQGMVATGGLIWNFSFFAGSYKEHPVISRIGEGPLTEIRPHVIENTADLSAPGSWDTLADAAIAKWLAVKGGTTFDNAAATLVGYGHAGYSSYAIIQVSGRWVNGPSTLQISYLVAASISHSMAAGAITTARNAMAWSGFTVGDIIVFETIQNITGSTLAAEYATNRRYPDLYLKSHFIHEDRLWVLAGSKVSASAPANFRDFSTAGEYFFIDFATDKLKSLDVINDTFYITADSAIYALSVGDDPNTNSDLAVISKAIGGEAACVLGDTLFVANPEALYSVSGSNLTKVFDLMVDYPPILDEALIHNGSSFTNGMAFNMKLAAQGNNLYISYRYLKAYTSLPGTYYNSPYDVEVVTRNTVSGDPAQQSRLFVLSMETGFLSEYTFDCIPVDLLYIPIEDHRNQNNMFILGGYNAVSGSYAGNKWSANRVLSIGSNPAPLSVEFTSITAVGALSYGTNTSDSYGVDTVTDSTDLSRLCWYTPEYRLRLLRHSPDELKYNMKKLRTIEFDMLLPRFLLDNTKNVLMTAWADHKVTVPTAPTDKGLILLNKALVSKITLPSGSTYVDTDLVMGAETLRYGLNQRSKFINIDLYAPSTQRAFGLGAISADALRCNRWEIVDIRTLWTPTLRGPTNDLVTA